MRLAANLSMLFSAQVTWQERCRRVAKQGFKGVEILFPYNKDIQLYKTALDKYNLETVLINTPSKTGSFGYAALPNHEKLFQQAFDQAFDAAMVLNANAIHVMAGISLSGPVPNWQTHLLKNIDYALTKVAGTNILLQLEALNSKDVPDYAYVDPLALIPIIQQLNSKQLGLQFDFYHTLVQGLHLLETLEKVRPFITHVQIADPQKRHEPNFDKHPQLLQGLKYLMETNYTGWVGLEYRPLTQFEESLGFLNILDNIIQQ